MPYLATAFPIFWLKLKCEIKKNCKFLLPGFLERQCKLKLFITNSAVGKKKKKKEKKKEKRNKQTRENFSRQSLNHLILWKSFFEHGLYELPRQLQNDLRLRILGN